MGTTQVLVKRTMTTMHTTNLFRNTSSSGTLTDHQSLNGKGELSGFIVKLSTSTVLVKFCFHRVSRVTKPPSYSKLSWTLSMLCSFYRYLNETGLCNRRFQSFIRKREQMSVVSVCNGHGRPLSGSYPGNLCISDSRMLVYHVKVSRDGRCKIEYLASKNESVIVACDKIVNRCRPVHLEGYRGQKPDPKARHCRPWVFRGLVDIWFLVSNLYLCHT